MKGKCSSKWWMVRLSLLVRQHPLNPRQLKLKNQRGMISKPFMTDPFAKGRGTSNEFRVARHPVARHPVTGILSTDIE
jgi:hypothetical protein